MSRSALVMSLIERAVSSLAESWVPTPSPSRAQQVVERLHGFAGLERSSPLGLLLLLERFGESDQL